MPQSRTPSGTPGRHSGLRPLVWILGILAALIVLVMVAVPLLVNSSAITALVHDRVLPQVSERIGREVTAGEVKVHILPAPSLRIDDVTVPGDTPDRPLIFSRSAVARLDVWTLLRSLGKEISLDSLNFREAEVNVVRHPDGTWSYQPILDRMKASKPDSAAAQQGRAVAIDRASLVDGLVRIVDQSAPGGDAVGEIRHLDLEARNIAFGKPLSVRLSAALQGENKNIEGNFKIDPLPQDIASLGPGNWPQLTGQIKMNDAPLGRLRNLLPGGLSEVVTGGRLDTHADISTEETGRYVARGDGRATELELRGKPARGSFEFVASVDPANRKDLRVDVSQLQVEGPGVNLAGNVSLQGTQRFQFALSGPLLDLDAVMAALPEKQPSEADAPLVPDAVRKKAQSIQGSGTLEVDRVIRGKLTANSVKTRATLSNGTIHLDEATAGFFGGSVDGSGSTLDLTQQTPLWNFQGSMQGVQMQQAMSAIAGNAPLTGTVGGQLELTGAGVDWAQLMQALTGTGAIRINQSFLSSANLEGAVATELSRGLSALGLGNPARQVTGAGTALGDIQARFVIRNGWLALRRPIHAETPFGAIDLGGRISLDKRLDLSGTATLAPDWLAQLTGNQSLASKGGIEIPLVIGGTLENPTVEGIPTESLAQALLPVGQVQRRVAQEAERQKNQALEQAQQKAREILKGF